MNAERHAGDVGAFPQHQRQRVARVRRLGLRRQPLDGMVGFRAVDPPVGMRPQSELEIEPARRRLVADETQHRQVVIALGVGQVRLLAETAASYSRE